MKFLSGVLLGIAVLLAFSTTDLLRVGIRTDAALATAAFVERAEPEESGTSAETAEGAVQRTRAATSLGQGEASFYGRRFAGRATASGEVFDPSALTAAHPSLPFGSRVRVTNTANGRSVVVRVNDRGPYVDGRLIDVSRGAAEQLGMVRSGTARVRLELIS